ncbi:MAG TPA: hypothetical protein EYG70_00275 [Sulfurimonas sp.]|nr:hypothetical protein [Sulfurimonas sp.]
MQTKDIPLHDIKPLIEIQEYSLYYFVALVAFVSVVVLALLYLAYQYMKNRNSFNIRVEHLKLLQKSNLDDAKKAAYELTLYGATFCDDNEQTHRAYEVLVQELESYKYKKDVESFSEETKRSINNYLGMIDV